MRTPEEFAKDVSPTMMGLRKELQLLKIDKFIYEWMERYAVEYHESKVKELNLQSNIIKSGNNILSIEFRNQLKELGFEHFGFGWFGNSEDTIRIRLWKNQEADFWLWRSSINTDDNEIHFRGKIYSIDDVKFVLEQCFNN